MAAIFFEVFPEMNDVDERLQKHVSFELPSFANPLQSQVSLFQLNLAGSHVTTLLPIKNLMIPNSIAIFDKQKKNMELINLTRLALLTKCPRLPVR